VWFGDRQTRRSRRNRARPDAATILIAAGEPSGDQNGAGLARALSAAAPGVRLVGVGGPAMRSAGVDLLLDVTHLTFTGLPSSIAHVREILARYRHVQRIVATNPPDLAVLIDSEVVNLPFARWLRAQGLPVAFFFPPPLWWRKWRLRATIPPADRLLCAFRGEAEFYRMAGCDAVWVGHPVRDQLRVDADADEKLGSLGIDPHRPLVVVMPGSRLNEIAALAPAFLGAARILRQRDPQLQFAIPLANEWLREPIEAAVAASGLGYVTIYPSSSYGVLSRARAVIQCSGTATLESALFGIPSVVAYRMRPMEYLVCLLGWYLLIRSPYISLPNILLAESVQPEFVQRLDPQRLAEETWSLLTDAGRRRAIQSRLARLGEMLGPCGAFERAASAVVECLRDDRSEDSMLGGIDGGRLAGAQSG
jgi:lipid-A-disaccharide synthase